MLYGKVLLIQFKRRAVLKYLVKIVGGKWFTDAYNKSHHIYFLVISSKANSNVTI